MGRRAQERGEAFPRAPTQEEWEAMRPEERARVVESLPAEVTWDEMAMPEGDRHFKAKVRALDMLRGYFRHPKRKVYLGAELPVYYPGERRFAPDVVAVLDVEPHERDKWVVSHEGRGLDWVLEVHVGGDRKKDAEHNVEHYARLGVPEYFIYDREWERLEAYRLPGPEAKQYEPIAAEQGRYRSEVLALELEVAEGELRLWAGNALLLTSEELLARMSAKLRELEQLADEAKRRREQAARLREAAERRLVELQAELERLRGSC